MYESLNVLMSSTILARIGAGSTSILKVITPFVYFKNLFPKTGTLIPGVYV